MSFSQLHQAEATLVAVHGLLIEVASVTADHRQVLENSLDSCGTLDLNAQGM